MGKQRHLAEGKGTSDRSEDSSDIRDSKEADQDCAGTNGRARMGKANIEPEMIILEQLHWITPKTCPLEIQVSMDVCTYSVPNCI